MLDRVRVLRERAVGSAAPEDEAETLASRPGPTILDRDERHSHPAAPERADTEPRVQAPREHCHRQPVEATEQIHGKLGGRTWCRQSTPGGGPDPDQGKPGREGRQGPGLENVSSRHTHQHNLHPATTGRVCDPPQDFSSRGLRESKAGDRRGRCLHQGHGHTVPYPQAALLLAYTRHRRVYTSVRPLRARCERTFARRWGAPRGAKRSSSPAAESPTFESSRPDHLAPRAVLGIRSVGPSCAWPPTSTRLSTGSGKPSRSDRSRHGCLDLVGHRSVAPVAPCSYRHRDGGGPSGPHRVGHLGMGGRGEGRAREARARPRRPQLDLPRLRLSRRDRSSARCSRRAGKHAPARTLSPRPRRSDPHCSRAASRCATRHE